QHVLEACKRRGVEKFLYAGAASVVFNLRDQCGIDERAAYPARFYDQYSETKARAEQLVLRTSGSDGLLACSLRPLLLWGPADPHFLPRLIASAGKRRLCIVGPGRNRVALTYIDNAALAHLLACDAMSPKRVAGEAYFISDDEPVVFWDWVNALLKELGLPPAAKRLPAPLAYAAGAGLERACTWLGKTGEPPLTRFLARALSCSHYYNLAKAKRDFGYRAVVTSAEGLRRTVERFRAHRA
ncbi:MAG: NAD-dependent epimerase/dehydratase family protein, partial [Planctomycetota bacterium]